MSIDMNSVSSTRTVCEVLREINDLAIERGMPELQALAMEATVMAKRMSDKLCEYKGFFNVNKELDPPENHNYNRSMVLRKGRDGRD